MAPSDWLCSVFSGITKSSVVLKVFVLDVNTNPTGLLDRDFDVSYRYLVLLLVLCSFVSLRGLRSVQQR